jgi:hypothetical protein
VRTVDEEDVWKKLAENIEKGARGQRDGEHAVELEKMLILLDNLFFKMESETGWKTARSRCVWRSCSMARCSMGSGM